MQSVRHQGVFLRRSPRRCADLQQIHRRLERFVAFLAPKFLRQLSQPQSFAVSEDTLRLLDQRSVRQNTRQQSRGAVLAGRSRGGKRRQSRLQRRTRRDVGDKPRLAGHRIRL